MVHIASKDPPKISDMRRFNNISPTEIYIVVFED
jgi:hypothetical protein